MKPKKIKFVSIAKIVLSSKDDSLTKLKPILGQNQISLNSFISDFNKETSNIVPEVTVRGVVLKNQDKSYSVKVKYTPLEIVFNSFREEKHITISEYQDIIRSLILFSSKKGVVDHTVSQEDRNKLYSKLLLSPLYAMRYKIKR